MNHLHTRSVVGSDGTMQAGHGSHPVVRVKSQGPFKHELDELATEIPVALEYNGIAHATLLLTPCDLHDFAYGFSYTEGVIRRASDIYGIDIIEQENGYVIQAEIASACLHQLKRRRRHMAGRTGCGLCGLESLDDVQRPLSALTKRPAFLRPQAIATALHQLRQQQALHQVTGATHAAAWANLDGTILYVREDVGRHNALDKLIGHLLRASIKPEHGFAVISSRASFEMVQKAASAGISALIAVSAPTSYAANLANSLNVFLAGFGRDHGFTVYAHPEFLSEDVQ